MLRFDWQYGGIVDESEDYEYACGNRAVLPTHLSVDAIMSTEIE